MHGDGSSVLPEARRASMKRWLRKASHRKGTGKVGCKRCGVRWTGWMPRPSVGSAFPAIARFFNKKVDTRTPTCTFFHHHVSVSDSSLDNSLPTSPGQPSAGAPPTCHTSFWGQNDGTQIGTSLGQRAAGKLSSYRSWAFVWHQPFAWGWA